MSAARGSDPERVFTREEFRAWAERQPRRYERIDGQAVAMAPQRAGHALVKAAVWVALRDAVRAAGLGACQVFPDGMTVEVDEQTDYEPDALVQCGEQVDRDAVAASRPVIVVEVLSPGSAAADTGAKLAGYFQVAAVSHYLIVDPRKPLVIHHRRGEAGGIETRIVTEGPIRLDPPGIVVAVADFYA